MKHVYIAGPLTHPDPSIMEDRRARALRMGQQVEEAGAFVAFVPHAHILEPHGRSAEAIWKAAMRKCISHLRRCDVLLPLPDWKLSRGARVEVWLCLRRSGFPPIVHSVNDLKEIHRAL